MPVRVLPVGAYLDAGWLLSGGMRLRMSGSGLEVLGMDFDRMPEKHQWHLKGTVDRMPRQHNAVYYE